MINNDISLFVSNILYILLWSLPPPDPPSLAVIKALVLLHTAQSHLQKDFFNTEYINKFWIGHIIYSTISSFLYKLLQQQKLLLNKFLLDTKNMTRQLQFSFKRVIFYTKSWRHWIITISVWSFNLQNRHFSNLWG